MAMAQPLWRPERAQSLVRRAQAWCGYVARQIGTVGLLALVALLLAVVLTVVTWRLRGAEELARAEEARTARALLNREKSPAPVASGVDAKVLISELPQARELPMFIEDVHAVASRLGLQIERAEYRNPVSLGGALWRAQVVMPVSGRYPIVLKWLGNLLEAYPSVALDELSLQRSAPGSEVLRARVVFSHYSRSEP